MNIAIVNFQHKVALGICESGIASLKELVG